MSRWNEDRQMEDIVLLAGVSFALGYVVSLFIRLLAEIPLFRK